LFTVDAYKRCRRKYLQEIFASALPLERFSDLRRRTAPFSYVLWPVKIVGSSIDRGDDKQISVRVSPVLLQATQVQLRLVQRLASYSREWQRQEELARWRPLRRPLCSREAIQAWWHYAARGALLTISPESTLFGWIGFWRKSGNRAEYELLLRELTKRKGKWRRDKVLAKTEFLKARLQEIDAQMTLKEIVRRRRDMLTDGVMVRKDDTMAASKTSPKGNSGEEAPSLVIEEKESDEDDFTSTRDDELPSTTIQINFAAVDLRIDTEPRSWHRAFARAVPNHLPLVRTLPELRAHATLDVDLEVVPKQRVRLYLHSFEVAQRGPLSENGFAETAMFRFGGTPCVVANLSRSLGENGKRNGASSHTP
jgi:hypothetical protein